MPRKKKGFTLSESDGLVRFPQNCAAIDTAPTFFLGLSSLLWRSIHHEGHEAHEAKQFKHQERNEKSEPFVYFVRFVVK